MDPRLACLLAVRNEHYVSSKNQCWVTKFSSSQCGVISQGNQPSSCNPVILDPNHHGKDVSWILVMVLLSLLTMLILASQSEESQNTLLNIAVHNKNAPN